MPRFLILATAASRPAAAARRRKADADRGAAAPCLDQHRGNRIPQPPDKPRIRFVRSILNRRRPRTEKEGRASSPDFAFFSGGEKNRDVQQPPYGIWRQGDKTYRQRHRRPAPGRRGPQKGLVQLPGRPRRGEPEVPVGVAVDDAGIAYVSDTGDGTVKAYSARGKLLWKSEGAAARPASSTVPPASPSPRPASSWSPTAATVASYSSARTENSSKEMCLHAKKEYYALPNPNNVWSFKKTGISWSAIPWPARVHIFSSTGAAVWGFGEPATRRAICPGRAAWPPTPTATSYVVDAIFSRVQVFDRAGQLLVWYGGPGDRPSRMALPAGIFIDKDDMIYISNSKDRRIEVFQYISYPEEKAAAAPPEQK